MNGEPWVAISIRMVVPGLDSGNIGLPGRDTDESD